MELIKQLEQRQLELGLSDRAFGKYLGVTGTQWALLKKGERNMGHKMMQGILRKFPELEASIIDHLRVAA